jgi:hypothetical protein
VLQLPSKERRAHHRLPLPHRPAAVAATGWWHTREAAHTLRVYQSCRVDASADVASLVGLQVQITLVCCPVSAACCNEWSRRVATADCRGSSGSASRFAGACLAEVQG